MGILGDLETLWVPKIPSTASDLAICGHACSDTLVIDSLARGCHYPDRVR